MNVTKLIEVARERPHKRVTMSRAAFTDSSEYLLLLADDWQVKQYDGAVIAADGPGGMSVRQVAHMEKEVPIAAAVDEWLKAHGIEVGADGNPG